jgi:hypothetical protein
LHTLFFFLSFLGLLDHFFFLLIRELVKFQERLQRKIQETVQLSENRVPKSSSHSTGPCKAGRRGTVTRIGKPEQIKFLFLKSNFFFYFAVQIFLLSQVLSRGLFCFFTTC